MLQQAGATLSAFVVSAPEDADLLDAKNWTRTNPIVHQREWLNTRNGEWLEGNAVVAPDGKIVDILTSQAMGKTQGRLLLSIQPYEYRWLSIA